MENAELLKTEYTVQLKWIDNQMANIENDGANSFSNIDVALIAYETMKKSLIISDSQIEIFVSTHLSETGKNSLITTLLEYKKKNSSERLQAEKTKRALMDTLSYQVKSK